MLEKRLQLEEGSLEADDQKMNVKKRVKHIWKMQKRQKLATANASIG